MKVKCWAACLGDCSDVQSREHLVSKSLFQSPQVRVQGFPWCGGQEVSIGLSALVGKVLCTRHNNSLTAIDSAGAEVFEALREIRRMENRRTAMKGRRWNVRRFRHQGLRLEGWFVKTLVNVALSGASNLKWYSNGFGLAQPPTFIVEAAFGVAALPVGAGLYAAATQGKEHYSTDTVGFAPMIKEDVFLIGGLFLFRGCQFILSLLEEHLPDRLDFIDHPDWLNARTIYRPEKIRFENQGYLSQELLLDW